MELMTVSQVSRSLGISTRMLRYYEQAGLVESLRQEGYAYRIYDEQAAYPCAPDQGDSAEGGRGSGD